MSSTSIERLATLIMACCAVATTGLVARRELTKRPVAAARQPVATKDWRLYAVGHQLGAPGARVVITEFSDFQCPFCRRLSAVLDTVESRHPGDVAVIYRHFPLEALHPFAHTAALASECAGAQGRFPQFYDWVFRQQDSLGRLTWGTVAERAGVADTVRFSGCVRDSTFAGVVAGDVAAGKRLGVQGTPTILVNQWRLFGTPNVRTLDSIVTAVLAARAAP